MAVRRKFDLRFKETVLQYAEETSGEQAARFFNIDSKRIRYWRKQRAELRSADEGRARLSRDGRKKLSVELERRLSEWIHAMRDRHQAVSADMIKNKALEIYPTVSDGGSRFVASTGWLQKFLKRYNLSLRRRSAVTQEDPNLLTEKLVWFVDYVGKTVSAKRILEKDIITMDETVAWFDASSPTQGVQGQERSQLTIILAAKADGTKLKPFIVFRGADGDEEAMRQQISGAVINTSPNGWINDTLVSDWLETVVGKSNATPRLLVWDSQRSHVSVTAKLKHDFNITPAVIPRGCTEYVQAHNVMWNQPLKQNLHDAYDRWMAGDYQKEYTAGGDLKPPARRLLVDWVVAAWDKLDTDMIRESFKVCGLSVKSDGSEDDVIACFKEGQPCAAGRDMLTRARQRSWENWSPVAEEEEDGVKDFYFEEEDEEELVFEEEEEDGDHTSLHCITHQDVKNVIAVKEEQQEWSSSVDQEDPEPPHIKEEQEEFWSSQEGEQLQGLEEADITKFTFTPVPVKSEDDEEKPQFEGHHCGGPGPVPGGGVQPVPGGGVRPVPRDSDPDLIPDTEDKKPDSSLVAEIEVSLDDWDKTSPETSEFSEPEIDEGDDWKPQSCLNSLKHKERPVRNGEKQFSCSECGRRFSQKKHQTQHMQVHIRKKLLTCSVCEQKFTRLWQVKRHKCAGRQSSELYQSPTEESGEAEQMETEADGEDCGGPEPARNSDPDPDLPSDTDDKTGDSSEAETDDSDDDWKETSDSLTEDEDEDDDDEDDDFTTGSSTTSQHPMKRRRDGSAAFRAREEEEGEEARWHNKEEKDKRPDPLRFIPIREPGPTLDPTASWSPLSLFQLFFSDSIVCTIIENTNANAAKRLKSGLKFVWKPLTVSDFYIFLSIIIFSGLVKVHVRGDYWRKEWPFNFRFPGETMRRDRFESILWSLHLSNPAEDEENDRKKNTAEYDRLFKIKPLYTEIVNACKVQFQPYQNISIDERMVASRARTGMTRYMKDKPTKWGYKIFVLLDSLTAYTWNFFVYEGRSVHGPGQGLNYTSVMDLMAFPLLGRGYTLFVDSFYSSTALFKELSRQDIAACGTVRKKQIGFPKTTQNDLPKNAERGDMRWIRQNNLLFVKWMDTREVTICSTVHEAFSGQTVQRKVKEAGVWQTKNITIPDSIVEYNRNRGGVDLSDALIGCYSVHHKTMKWYKRFFYHFMDIAVVNSFLLHKELHKKKNDPVVKKPLSQKRFREKLAAEMLWYAKDSAPPTSTPAACMPAYFGDNGTESRKYCKRCQDAGIKRMKTPVYCMKCQVPLCFNARRNCFKDWHNK
ncbi:uncharacterized protein LOC117263673 [Epinephelus lanceolatus]